MIIRHFRVNYSLQQLEIWLFRMCLYDLCTIRFWNFLPFVSANFLRLCETRWRMLANSNFQAKLDLRLRFDFKHSKPLFFFSSSSFLLCALAPCLVEHIWILSGGTVHKYGEKKRLTMFDLPLRSWLKKNHNRVTHQWEVIHWEKNEGIINSVINTALFRLLGCFYCWPGLKSN